MNDTQRDGESNSEYYARLLAWEQKHSKFKKLQALSNAKKQPNCEKKCCSCKEKDMVVWIEDPFLLELYNKSVWKWFCADCYQMFCESI